MTIEAWHVGMTICTVDHLAGRAAATCNLAQNILVSTGVTECTVKITFSKDKVGTPRVLGIDVAHMAVKTHGLWYICLVVLEGVGWFSV
jgi:hypothetical protein